MGIITAQPVTEEAYPLSFMQQGMLFHSLYNPHGGVDIEQMVITLPEPVHARSLRTAWLAVIRRHAALRTAFQWDGEQPLQVVQPEAVPAWEEVDCRTDSEAEWSARQARFLEEDRRRGFDMAQAPLLRLTFFERADADYRLVWTFHHAILDGRAFTLILNEVFACYEALQNGKELHLDSPRPYRDYISWLHQQDLKPAETYWRATLQGIEETSSLTAAFPHRQTQPGLYSVREIRLSEALTAAIQDLSERHDLTPNTLLQGAWAILLSRYTGKQDVVFGVTRACR
ncbi:MAG TPA: condensation domain-containing protein, partial [Chthonomonadaceae bacterium]|nr:condensation domain-containing protein [Chthonomonadaceae bacterium]